ncbi:MAG: ATP synthase subunit I [Oxalobacteraceae bacterium]|nr:ATP synthase subunit I [Oxalobacteraceae bacterium]
MLRLIAIQVAATTAAALLASLWGGVNAFSSALLGGLCCVVPNGLFAMYLQHRTKKLDSMAPSIFFIGEFAKITLTVACLAAVAFWYQDLNWLAMLMAFIVALKSYAVMLFRH